MPKLLYLAALSWAIGWVAIFGLGQHTWFFDLVFAPELAWTKPLEQHAIEWASFAPAALLFALGHFLAERRR